jgi:hypothetical protein
MWVVRASIDELDHSFIAEDEERPKIKYRPDATDGDARKTTMVDITSVAHFTIPVSDMERSKVFYTEVVGHLPSFRTIFFDSGGTCVILVKRDAPIHRQQEGSDGVHHAFRTEAHS